MKMNLNLTADEGMKVIEALQETAISFGWAEEDFDTSGVIAEYSAVVDAALTAMGIEVTIDPEEEDDEDEYDSSIEDKIFTENGLRVIKHSDAKEYIDFLNRLIVGLLPKQDEEIQDEVFARIWTDFLKEYEIDDVRMGE